MIKGKMEKTAKLVNNAIDKLQDQEVMDNLYNPNVAMQFKDALKIIAAASGSLMITSQHMTRDINLKKCTDAMFEALSKLEPLRDKLVEVHDVDSDGGMEVTENERQECGVFVFDIIKSLLGVMDALDKRTNHEQITSRAEYHFNKAHEILNQQEKE